MNQGAKNEFILATVSEGGSSLFTKKITEKKHSSYVQRPFAFLLCLNASPTTKM